ncbi:hypothetical protein, partial [Rhodalgimonas zhirmunskyi]
EEPRINVTPSAQCALLLSALNAQGQPYDLDKVIRAFSDDRQKHALGQTLRQKLLDELSGTLSRLQDHYGVHFDMTLPDEPKHILTRLHPQVCAPAILKLL